MSWKAAFGVSMPSPPGGANAPKPICPTLLDDIRAIVDSQSQTDPQFRTTRLYTRLSAAEVRRQLHRPERLPG